MVQSPVKILSEDSCVQQLIDESSGSWKKRLLEDIFIKNEAVAICSIPISIFGAKDKVVWGCTYKGAFSVKSAYHLEHSRIRDGKSEHSNVAEAESGWNSIWKLNI